MFAQQKYVGMPQLTGLEGGKHNLGDFEIEECKLECKHLGDPPPLCGREGDRKLGPNGTAEEN